MAKKVNKPVDEQNINTSHEQDPVWENCGMDLSMYPPCMNAQQLAAVLKTHDKAVYRVIKRHDFFPGFKVLGAVRISRDALIDWIELQCKKQFEEEEEEQDE
ncbi:MAG: helix-turn-helix domain-containing protein [Clostridia bacterium]|nr:helix-turn-helix domain-containing protein [Clostridia bacterium]